jgi:ABC-type antimicrobial peptide transport system permease subunit
MLFAASALLVASLGIYGIVAYSVAWRRNEIGIRMALGAQRSQVLGLVIRQGMTPVVAGLTAGVAVPFCSAGPFAAYCSEFSRPTRSRSQELLGFCSLSTPWPASSPLGGLPAQMQLQRSDSSSAMPAIDRGIHHYDLLNWPSGMPEP